MPAKENAANKIGLDTEGTREIHAVDTTGNYATLCGLDGDENEVFNVKRGERINCHSCIAIWIECRKYRQRDFDPKCLTAVYAEAK